MIAKFGPFANRDCCAGVRGVVDRLITHFMVLSLLMHVWLELKEGWLGAPVGPLGAVAVLVEGVEVVGVAEVVGLQLALDEVLENPGCHILVSTQRTSVSISVVKIWRTP